MSESLFHNGYVGPTDPHLGIVVMALGLLDTGPTRYSGDGNNPRPGPMTCPFAIFEVGEYLFQVTFSAACEGDVRVVSVLRYHSSILRKP